MRIALTHNLQVTDTEEEAELDRPETIQALSQALRRLGHTVEPVEVSGPASRTVARLEALNPAIEATDEWISNALCMAEGMSGVDDHHAPALPLDDVQRIVQEDRVP